jgi:hydrogenase assembly chaperone HypC/HupF
MCLAYPARVTSLPAPGAAEVEVDGRRQRVLTLALDDPTGVRVGDWLLVQSGLAVRPLTPAEAGARWRLLSDAAAAQGAEGRNR